MNAQLPATRSTAEIMETVLVKGDLSKLTVDERNSYYFKMCESMGLNPLTRPIEYIQLNNRLTLYAKKDCTDQLRAIHKVSVTDMTETERDGVYIVTSKVANAEGRTDIAKGAVNIQGLKGENLANAIMKAETKSKRRATLSICGLGILDETEVEDIPSTQKREVVSEVPSPPALPNGPHMFPRDGKGMKAWSDAYLGYIRSSTSVKELRDWDSANGETLDAINTKEPELYDIINRTVEARMREINPPPPPQDKRKRQPAPKPQSEIPDAAKDPEAFLKWADERMSRIATAEELEGDFNTVIEPAAEGMFPPDHSELCGMYERHLRKFEA